MKVIRLSDKDAEALLRLLNSPFFVGCSRCDTKSREVIRRLRLIGKRLKQKIKDEKE